MVDLFQTDQSTFEKNHTFSSLENSITFDGRSVLTQIKAHFKKNHTFSPLESNKIIVDGRSVLAQT